jgi:hypothetical protein
MFSESDLVFSMWEQDGKINQYHLAHYPNSGGVRTSCGMVILTGQEPTLAQLEKPTHIPCCSVCEGKSAAFSKRYFGGRKLSISGRKKVKQDQKHVGDEMARLLQPDEKKKPGMLF